MFELPKTLRERFARGELVAAVAQDAHTLEVLMVAWMNEEALEKTLRTGLATYWSRSRESIWVKGETSGNSQQVVSVEVDCDSDALLVKVNQTGVACHTGQRTCFHTALTPSSESSQAGEREKSRE